MNFPRIALFDESTIRRRARLLELTLSARADETTTTPDRNNAKNVVATVCDLFMVFELGSIW